MTEQMKELLIQYAEEVRKQYSNALKAVVLYGSYARGDNTNDSDIDILILVNLPEDEICRSREKISDLTYEFNENHELQIMPVVISQNQFEYWLQVYPFYQNIEKDGVNIYAA